MAGAGRELIVTTAQHVDGYRVARTISVVRGITVRSRSLFGTIGAQFQAFRGGRVSILVDLCEQTRAEAFRLAVRYAEELGADALIALRYDATEILPGVTEVLCYGTAVALEPVERGAGVQHGGVA